jgi:hypothetical protein
MPFEFVNNSIEKHNVAKPAQRGCPNTDLMGKRASALHEQRKLYKAD